MIFSQKGTSKICTAFSKPLYGAAFLIIQENKNINNLVDNTSAFVANNSASAAEESALVPKHSTLAAGNSTLEKKYSALVANKSRIVPNESGIAANNSSFVHKNSAFVGKNSGIVANNSAIVSKNSAISNRNSGILIKNEVLTSFFSKHEIVRSILKVLHKKLLIILNTYDFTRRSNMIRMIIILCCFCMVSNAQSIDTLTYSKSSQRNNKIFVEVGGNGLLISVNYERLINFYGIRIGFGALPLVGKSFPIMFNYYLGSEKSWELGIGLVYVDANNFFGTDGTTCIISTIGHIFQSNKSGIIFRFSFTPFYIPNLDKPDPKR